MKAETKKRIYKLLSTTMRDFSYKPEAEDWEWLDEEIESIKVLEPTRSVEEMLVLVRQTISDDWTIRGGTDPKA